VLQYAAPWFVRSTDLLLPPPPAVWDSICQLQYASPGSQGATDLLLPPPPAVWDSICQLQYASPWFARSNVKSDDTKPSPTVKKFQYAAPWFIRSNVNSATANATADVRIRFGNVKQCAHGTPSRGASGLAARGPANRREAEKSR